MASATASRPTSRPRRRRGGAGGGSGSPAALVTGLLALGGLIAGGLTTIDLKDPSDRAQDVSAIVAPGQRGVLIGKASILDLVGQPQRMAQEIGGRATGNDLQVQAVVPRQGFWVGTDKVRRVYVEYGGKVGENETTKGLPKVGDRVDLIGHVRPAPKKPERTLRLNAADGAQVRAQGAYVNADTYVQGDKSP